MRQGQRLNDRYRLDERVAAGGMGEVWKGYDERLNRIVAVKVLHHALASDVVFQHRFHIEARAIAALQHPGVVNIYDFGDETGEDGQIVYLVMEYVDGKSLQQILQEGGKLDVDETMRVIAGTAEALQVAHRAQIIHRDIKPGNILISKNGAPRIVDFGIARTAGAAGLTNTGMVMGTAAYVAPEQLRGDDPTPAADIYSLGVVAYQCLSGRKPFDSDVPATIIATALSDEPPPLPEEIPETVAAIVLRALAKEPDGRWASAADFAAACRKPDNAPVSPAPAGDAATMVTPASAAEAPTVVTPPPPGDAASQDADSVTPPSMRGSAPPQHPGQNDGPLTPVPQPKPRRNGLLIGIIVILVLLLLGVGGYVVYLRPWVQTNVAQPGGEETSAVEEATSEESPSESESSSSPEPTTSSAEPTSESESPEPETAEIPPVDGLSEEEAIQVLNGEGFENIVTEYDGDGAKVCSVDSQAPEPYQEAELTTEITIYVQYVDDLTDCRYAGAG
ncbi:serine/threonine protein kinase [Stackebrandtia nassauensis]|uniref:non-specific serine/threonine protein kinase n=1 Tax=Stackebrandtia nassauensis (strain DSM 44728 / CIP 108903 / NRRL B-16338 / NBRC 102104 / LLR-40K-21) TaxID=446470 RepID=D3Q0N5_STANL|nr:serine/threonine protein kinase [Stackebrandtia nassauensis]ADD41771.1 serine/threonine protein kinase with PASTA sensor(s) [Stackebrandtia nassauensis DSM 44728]